MAIVVRSNERRSESQAYFALQPGQACFYCGGEIADIAVMWSSGEGSLWLHKDCCQALWLRLSRDCWEIECKMSTLVSQATRRDNGGP